MLSVQEVLSRVDLVKLGYDFWRKDPFFLYILSNESCYLYLHEIDDYCPDEILPMILEHSNYVNGIFLDKPPKREIVIQLVRDLLEKKPYLELTPTHHALSWITDCKFRFRNICVCRLRLEDLRSVGELLTVKENDIKMLTSGLNWQENFISYLEHPNCRVRELTIGTSGTNMTMFRNTLVRHVTARRFGSPDLILLPYQVGEGEFETMLRGLHKLRGCLPNDLWRVIFYFL